MGAGNFILLLKWLESLFEISAYFYNEAKLKQLTPIQCTTKTVQNVHIKHR